MKIHQLHRWDLDPSAAIALQNQLAARVDTGTPLTRWDLIAGADVSFDRDSPIFYAAVVVLSTKTWEVVEVQGAVRESTFPYVPGLLSFREAPVLLDALAKVQSEPDAVMFDGQGIAHPRGLGIASHVGLWLDVPSLGCAKSLLYGRYREPGEKVGDMAPLTARGQVIGEAVRTKKRTKAVLVSAGHRIDLPSAVKVVLWTCRGYRLPEPTRLAHLQVNAFRRQGGV